MTTKNLFATILTHPAPSSNYRGESEENRTIIQKISKKGYEYAVISPEAMRNALREILIGYGLPMNRRRLNDEDQLAVEFKSFPDAAAYADDFLFGFLVADKNAIKANDGKPAKRDSVLRMNLAVALTPYRFDATFHQSPLNGGESPWQNSKKSALLHREVSYASYQYPIAIALSDTLAVDPRQKGDGSWGHGQEWTRALLKAIGELNNVAGGHARSYYEMAPQSLVARLTPSLVAGYDSYAFDDKGTLDSLLTRINPDDLPAQEFWLGGEVVRNLSAAQREQLTQQGAHLFDNPQKMIEELGQAAYA